MCKTLNQDVCGLEHIITTPKAFIERLVEKWGKLEYEVEDKHFSIEAGTNLLFAAMVQNCWKD
jgi:hypothetical protein